MTTTPSQRARELLAAELRKTDGASIVADRVLAGGAAGVLASTALRAIEAALRLPAGEDDTARLDYIERTFSGMTNRERYLPVQMVWGKGCNGRTLREACDKYMRRDAAAPRHETGEGES